MQKFIEFVRNIEKYQEEGQTNIFNEKSVLWNFILDSRSDLKALSDDDLIYVFDNFLNPTSKQTSGVSDWKRELSADLKKYYEELIPNEIIKLLPEPEVGNPLKFPIHDGRISSAYAWNLMLYKVLTSIYSEKIGEFEIWGNVVEIGAGYGCLALNLIRSNRANSYTIIDLHENLMNSFYFLSKTIPVDWEIKIVSSESLERLKEKTIYLLSPGYIDSLNSISYDVALNSDSLGEMPKTTAFAYVEWINEHLKPNGGIFFSKNGHLRSLVGVDRLSAYGYDKFSLVDLRPNPYSSSALDDFSHLITLKSVNILWSDNQKNILM